MKNIYTNMVLLTLIVSGHMSAGEVVITHNFQPNTSAKASEVNKNFSDVKIAVDDNHSKLIALGNVGVSAYVNGQNIGAVVQADFYSAELLSNSSYFFRVFYDGSLNYVDSVMFDGINCLGNAYFPSLKEGTMAAHGTVVIDSNSGDTWQVAQNSISVSITIESTSNRFQGGCSNNSSTMIAFPMIQNNVSITGVPNGGFSGAIVIGQ